MLINRQRLLIKGNVSEADKLTPKQIADIETVMTVFAANEIHKKLNQDLKEHYISFFKMLFNSSYENQILWIRYWHYKRAVKKAFLRMRTEGYKMYVVRNSKVGYKVISTLDFKYNQRISILKNKLTKQEIEKVAALIVYDDGTTTGPGFSSGSEVDILTKKTITNVRLKKKRTLKK